ncbi:hypothetical protein MG295_00252 [Bacillus phage vB_BcgM]|nr:hypothetical protein MG295_00252 [Bacillus phage vB_BcgM]
MGWALDGGEDIGGQFADRDMWAEEMTRITGIKEDRKNRIKKLSGQFVIITDGKSSKKVVYFQNPNISKGGYWTQFLSNALGFKTLKEANNIKKGFKYNNPRVGIVTANGTIQLV